MYYCKLLHAVNSAVHTPHCKIKKYKMLPVLLILLKVRQLNACFKQEFIPQRYLKLFFIMAKTLLLLNPHLPCCYMRPLKFIKRYNGFSV